MTPDYLKVMDEVMPLREAARLLKMPAASVRRGRGDCRCLTPVRFTDSVNAQLYYLKDEVYAILRDRAAAVDAARRERRQAR